MGFFTGWGTLFSFKLGNHILPFGQEKHLLAAEHVQPLIFAVNEADNVKVEELANKINNLDKAAFYLQTISAFIVAALQAAKKIYGDDANMTLNNTIDYLSVAIPLATGAAGAILTKERNDAIQEKQTLLKK